MVEAGLFALCAGVSLLYEEPDYIYFVQTMGINIALGGSMVLVGKRTDNLISRRDGYCIVSVSWLLFTALGMLPFYFSGYIPSVADAFFETMSGFTTTGATILDDIESLPYGLLFWRSLTPWIGGLGIVLFTIALLPLFSGSSQQLFLSEATGVTHDKIHPKAKIMARYLWLIHIGLTLVETILLMCGGMNLFDAICHSFATTATGGFSTKQERELFLLLISVSGIGGNTARMILSALSPSELCGVISSGNDKLLKTVKGIGLKTAQRIIVDLKDKIASSGMETVNSEMFASAANSEIHDEAVAALTMLGFAQAASQKVVAAILKEEPSAPVEKVIKLALKRL